MRWAWPRRSCARSRRATWPTRWGALARTLEQAAPTVDRAEKQLAGLETSNADRKKERETRVREWKVILDDLIEKRPELWLASARVQARAVRAVLAKSTAPLPAEETIRKILPFPPRLAPRTESLSGR